MSRSAGVLVWLRAHFWGQTALETDQIPIWLLFHHATLIWVVTAISGSLRLLNYKVGIIIAPPLQVLSRV